jgi:hypothetical protein
VQSGLATPAPLWLLPLRDLLSLAVVAASYLGDEVEWRGQVLHTGLDRSERAAAAGGDDARRTSGVTFGRLSR